jgi:UDP-N-acetylglucosamine 2-epimerase (non-hydrolysing)
VAAGTAKLVGTDRALIVRETLSLLDDDDAYQAMARAHNPIGNGKAAQRIAEVIGKG